MGESTSSYATAGTALRISEALKPHHHDKVETPLVGFYENAVWEIKGRMMGWAGDVATTGKRRNAYNVLVVHLAMSEIR
jgi:hypothetical protein